MNTTVQARQTAYKVWVSQIVNSNFIVSQDDWEPNYFLLDGKKISRVNLIASVVVKYEGENKEYANVTIDDGSASIKVKAWREDAKILNKLVIGDLVLIIGRVRKLNDEIYISPEIARRLDNLLFARLRLLELKKLYGDIDFTAKQETTPTTPQENTKEYQEELIEGASSINKRQKIISLIESMESEDGVDIFEIINASKLPLAEAQGIVYELIRDGEIFEISSNRIKLVK